MTELIAKVEEILEILKKMSPTEETTQQRIDQGAIDPETKPKKKVSLADLQTAAMALRDANGSAAVRAILDEFEVDRLSNAADELYPDLLKALQNGTC